MYLVKYSWSKCWYCLMVLVCLFTVIVLLWSILTIMFIKFDGAHKTMLHKLSVTLSWQCVQTASDSPANLTQRWVRLLLLLCCGFNTDTMSREFQWFWLVLSPLFFFLIIQLCQGHFEQTHQSIWDGSHQSNFSLCEMKPPLLCLSFLPLVSTFYLS